MVVQSCIFSNSCLLQYREQRQQPTSLFNVMKDQAALRGSDKSANALLVRDSRTGSRFSPRRWRPLPIAKSKRKFRLPISEANDREEHRQVLPWGLSKKELSKKGHSIRRARMGSVRVARQAGNKHAADAVTVITANADAKAKGSRGLT